MTWGEMKPHLRSLRIGQKIWALVEEVMAQNEVVINFGGDLVRVLNMSSRILRAGQRVLLEVQTIQPLQLKLVSRSQRPTARNLDVTA